MYDSYVSARVRDFDFHKCEWCGCAWLVAGREAELLRAQWAGISYVGPLYDPNDEEILLRSYERARGLVSFHGRPNFAVLPPIPQNRPVRDPPVMVLRPRVRRPQLGVSLSEFLEHPGPSTSGGELALPAPVCMCVSIYSWG